MWFTLFCTLLRVNLFGMSFTVDLFRNAHGIVGVRTRFVLGMKVVTWFETVVDAEFQFFDSCFLFENNTIWGGGGVQQNRIEYPVRSTCIYTISFKLTIFIRGSWGECESSDQFFTCAEFPPPPEDRCCIVLFLCNHLSHEKKNDYIALFPPRKMIWLIHIF